MVAFTRLLRQFTAGRRASGSPVRDGVSTAGSGAMKPSPSRRWKRLGLLAACAGGIVLAATSFDPDLVDSATGATQPVGFVGAPTGSGYVLTGEQVAYTIDYNSLDWSGDLRAFPITSTGVGTADTWGSGAANALDALDWNTDRVIVTRNDTGTPIPFRWSNLAAGQKAALGNVESVLNYLRGDRANEDPKGQKYRARSEVLGDIIHSTPLHWNDGTDRTVFVGANDGMLHAFDAVTGQERWAFVPSVFLSGGANASKLRQLIANPYLHHYFVDGQLGALKFTAFTESGGTARAAKAILAGGLGAGGKALFGIDITSVPAFTGNSATDEPLAAAKILWEITNTGSFANLGYTYSRPALTRLPNGDAAVIVGNGYNNTGNYGSSLFIINAYTGALIREIAAGSGTSASPNGLSSPTLVDTDLDGRADVAYAGDIDGNLWKFDLSAYTATKLLTTSPAQAITMAPGYAAHPNGGRMVVFATGKIFTSADMTDTATHYAYGVWDRPAAYALNDTLLTQTLTEQTYTSVTPNVRVRTATSNVPNWTAATAAGQGRHMGWKVALGTTSPSVTGERVMGDGGYVTGSVFLFMTSNPTINPTATPPGENWWMQLNALTGGDNGLVRYDLNADSQFTTADQVNGVSPVGRHMGGGIRSQLTAFTTGSGLDLYEANYDLNGKPKAPTVTTSMGVSNGHFDFDIFFGTASFVGKSGAFSSDTHKHQYDDVYNVTGVNMLNPDNPMDKLSRAVAAGVRFKVLVHNQYLNPAATIHIGKAGYSPTSTAGFVPISSYMTTSTLDLATVPAYTLDTIQSLALNLPTDAFAPRDWWGGALGLAPDVRVGLHPTPPGCVKTSKTSTTGGNLYWPVTPPPRVLAGAGAVSATGNGTIPSPRTSGVRHNGALTIQIIKDTTTNSQIEMNVPGSPEYGWRLTSAAYPNQALAEYTMFWHHPNNLCYGDAGWTKLAPPDTSSSKTVQEPSNSGTDPYIGSFGGTPTVGTVTSTANGVTTTTVTTLNADGTYTVTTTVTSSSGSTTTSLDTNTIQIGGVVSSTGVISGGVTTPTGTLGRVNWRELRK